MILREIGNYLRDLRKSRWVPFASSLAPSLVESHFVFLFIRARGVGSATRFVCYSDRSLVVYGSARSYRICDKIFHAQWKKGNYCISRMTVNKITAWIWRWRVWKVKKVRKTMAMCRTARRTESTTKVNRYR